MKITIENLITMLTTIQKELPKNSYIYIKHFEANGDTSITPLHDEMIEINNNCLDIDVTFKEGDDMGHAKVRYEIRDSEDMCLTEFPVYTEATTFADHYFKNVAFKEPLTIVKISEEVVSYYE